MSGAVEVIGALAGLITACLAGWALVKKASAPESRAVNALRSIYEWLDGEGLLERVPRPMRARMEKVLDVDEDVTNPDDETAAKS